MSYGFTYEWWASWFARFTQGKAPLYPLYCWTLWRRLPISRTLKGNPTRTAIRRLHTLHWFWRSLVQFPRVRELTCLAIYWKGQNIWCCYFRFLMERRDQRAKETVNRLHSSYSKAHFFILIYKNLNSVHETNIITSPRANQLTRIYYRRYLLKIN